MILYILPAAPVSRFKSRIIAIPQGPACMMNVASLCQKGMFVEIIQKITLSLLHETKGDLVRGS